VPTTKSEAACQLLVPSYFLFRTLAKDMTDSRQSGQDEIIETNGQGIDRVIWMQGFSDSKSQIKRLGELLHESGYLNEEQLQKAVDVSRKNFQSLGKVLVASKSCSEEAVNNALEVQKVCKLEGMSGNLAVRTLSLIRKDKISCREALEKIGWTAANYSSFQEPENIVAAKKALKEPGKSVGIPYATALQAIGDAYARNNLMARAEMQYEQASEIYKKCLPESASQLAAVLSKLSKQAVAFNRHDEAKNYLEQAQACLEESGNKQSKEYAIVMHVSAEYHISKRNFSEAEQYYKDCFAMLEPLCGLQDPQVLETIRKYVEIVDKGKRERTQATLTELWHEMSHEREPDKITLGELLKGARMLEEKDLQAAWQHSKDAKVPLGRALVQLNLLTEMQLQQALQVQTMVRNAELTAQLGIWLILYTQSLNLEIDPVLEMFHCAPRSQSPLSEEMRAAAARIRELEKTLPPTHPDLGFAHAKLGRIYFYRQQYVEADQHYKRAAEIISANQNVSPENVVELLDHYAEVKVALEDASEAVRIGKLAVVARSKYFGQESVPYAKGIEKLAQIFCGTGDHLTAVSGFNRALSVREKLYGSQDRELVGCLVLKAECLVHADDRLAGEQVFDLALEIASKTYGPYNEHTERIKKKLAVVCKALGKLEKIRQLRPGSIGEEEYFQI
jgi:tetratricopeptide (TPR) repeat protein